MAPLRGIAPQEIFLNAEHLHQHAEIFIWDFGTDETLTTADSQISYTFKKAGTYSIKLRYLKNKQDKLDKGKDGGTRSIVILPNKLPKPVLNCDSKIINKVECNATGSTDEDGSIKNYKYEWGDSSSQTEITSDNKEHIYSSGGLKTIRLTVTDDKGGSSTIEKEVYVKANTPPVANFECQKNGIQQISCNSTSNDVDEELTDLKWTLDDGSTYSGKSFVHKFSRPIDVAISSHAVTLKATDSYNATDSRTKNIEVDLEPIRQAPRAYFKIYQDGTTIDLRSFITRTQFDIKKATFTIYGPGSQEAIKTIELADFYANTSTKVDMGAYGGYRINLNVTDMREQRIQYSVPFSLVEDTSTLKPYVEFRAIQSGPRTAYINLNPTFDFDENYFIRSYIVKFGDGQEQEITDDTFISHTYAEEGNYTITLTAKTNHNTENSLAKVLAITDSTVQAINPDPTFSYRIYNFAQNVSFYDERSGTPNGEIISYQWNFGDGTSGTGRTQAHFYAPGTYVVSLTVVDTVGLSSTQFQKVTVSATGEDIVANIDCNQRQPYLDITQLCKVNALDRYNEINRIRVVWGDGTVLTLATPFDPRQGIYFPQKKYNTEGTYPVRLIVNTARGAFKIHDISHTITARRPVANIQCTVNNLLVFCDALGSYDPKGTQLTYTFDFGNGHTETNTTGVVTYAYAFSGLYDVSVKVTDETNLFSISSTKIQAVKPPNINPIADFICDSPEPYTIFCSENGISDPDGYIVSKKITYDDGDYGFLNQEIPSRKQFATSGLHKVILTVIDNDGGITSVLKQINVKYNKAPIITSVECDSSAPQIIDCHVIAFDEDSNDTITNYKWTMGDGLQTVETLLPTLNNYHYELAGEKNISVTVSDKYGEVSTIESRIVVKANAQPVASFQCEEERLGTIKCLSNSTDIDNNILSYEWKVDGATVSTNPDLIHNFTSGLEHRVELKVVDSFGAWSTFFENLTISLNQKPSFDWAIVYQTNTLPVKISFALKNVDDPDGEIAKVLWDFGDGYFSEKETEIHSYTEDGIYLVKAKVVDNLGGVTEKSIELPTNIFEKISIDTDINNGYLPLNVNFSAHISNAFGNVVQKEWSHEGTFISDEDSINFEIDNTSEPFLRFTVVTDQGLSFFRDSEAIQGTVDLSNCPIAPTAIETKLEVNVTYDEVSRLYTYNYELQNMAESELGIGLLFIQLSQPPFDINSPTKWIGRYNEFDETTKYVFWMKTGNSINPSEAQSGFTIKSPYPPGPIKYYSIGDSEIPSSIVSTRSLEGNPMCPGFFYGEPNGFGKFVVGVTQGPSQNERVSLDAKILKSLNDNNKLKVKRSAASFRTNYLEEIISKPAFFDLRNSQKVALNGNLFPLEIKTNNLFKKIEKIPNKGKFKILVNINPKFDLMDIPLNEIKLGPNKITPESREFLLDTDGQKKILLSFTTNNLGLKCNVDRFVFLESKMKGKELMLPFEANIEKCTKKHLKYEI